MVPRIRSQKDNSLRTSGAFIEEEESAQNDKAACSSLVLVLARGYACCSTIWTKKLNKKFKDIWPKD